MFKDPKAIRKALFIAQNIAAKIDPSFSRVPLPEIAKAESGLLKSGAEPSKSSGGEVDADGGDVENEPAFHSQAARVAASLPQKVGTASQLLGMVKNTPGVKPEELEYAGNPFGEDKINREQLSEHFESSAPQIKEVWKGGEGASPTKHDDPTLRLPGGENYKELLLTLPNDALNLNDTIKKNRRQIEALRDQMRGTSGTNEIRSEISRLHRENDAINQKIKETPFYKHSHWDEPNILAHARFDDRVGPNGEKVLHIAEVQSDWHQAGREKGYQTNNRQQLADQMKKALGESNWAKDADEEGLSSAHAVIDNFANDNINYNRMEQILNQKGVPLSVSEIGLGTKGVLDAPFKKTWPELTMKRILRHAAENGYDRVSWDTGDTNADRYDLSKQVSSIQRHFTNDGRPVVQINGTEGEPVYTSSFNESGHLTSKGQFEGKHLNELVGQDLAKKIMAAKEPKTFSGLDLKVGGEGMRGFYDQILPSVVNKLVKKHGVKTEPTQIKASKIPNYDDWEQDYIQNNGRQTSRELDNAYEDAGGFHTKKVHSIRITPSMREAFSKSQPMFKRGGMVEPNVVDPEKAKRRALTVARGMHKAEGGEVENGETSSSKNTKVWAQAGQPTRTFNDPQSGNKHVFAVTDPSKEVTTKSLASEVSNALARHMSLPYAQQVANSKSAAEKLSPYVGKDSAGSIKPFLTMNAKLEKASAGYEGGKGYEGASPLQLEDGIGVKTIGLPLSPAYQHGKYKICANAASCKENCLGQHSGNYSNKDWWPQQNSVNKTHAFLSEPGALAVQLHNEIKREKYAAEMQGNKLAVRMNVLSDTDPRVWEPLIKAHPDVDFYDYTKMNYDPIAPNHHYTYSSTGASQPASVTGLDKDIQNPHQNWKQMRQRLDTGSNVAMVFSHNDHLPHEVHDQETGKSYRVIDGTTHDYRPLDKQPEGADGVIIGLRNLDHRLGRDVAAEKSNGFMVHYDPKIQMVPNKKTGEPTKKAAKDEFGATIPTNRTVEIAPQGQRFVPHNLRESRATGGAVGQDMPPEYAVQQFHNFDKFDEPNEGPAMKVAGYTYGGPVEGDISHALALTRRYVRG